MKPVILGLLIGVLGSYSAHAQGSGSHGGDGLVIEFTGTARNIVEAMGPLGDLSGCPTQAQFKEVIAQTKVISEPTVLIDYVEHDAKNDPDTKLITLSRARLPTLSDPLAYVNLVMHEYFGILKLEGTNDTSVSQLCLNQIRKQRINLRSLIYKINPITTFEEQLSRGKAALQCVKDLTSIERIMVSTDDQLLWAKEDSDHLFHLIRHGDIRVIKGGLIQTVTNQVLENIRSEFDPSTGEVIFRMVLTTNCSRFVLTSKDHASWDVMISNTKYDGCTYESPDGTWYRRGCTPVYYQGKIDNVVY